MGSLVCVRLQHYLSDVQVLRSVDIAFPTEGITAIIGPNGAGKSTLINVMTGFMKPHSGRVFFNECEITGFSPHRIARLGVVRTFQDLRLINEERVLDNVLLARPYQRGESLLRAIVGRGLSAEEERNRNVAMRLLRLVGLDDKVMERTGDLSYGQQKLLSLAVCLAAEPTLLLLDEPVSGVHPLLAEKILSVLRELSETGKIVIFVEHDLQVVQQFADYVLAMDHGRLIAQGVPKVVLERPEILEAYVG
jgi:ABC-type branched-subunit amino acid transport system ATPase component